MDVMLSVQRDTPAVTYELHDAFDDRTGERPLVLPVGEPRTLIGIAHETELDEDGGGTGVAQHIEHVLLDAAVHGTRVTHHPILHGMREVAAVVELRLAQDLP